MPSSRNCDASAVTWRSPGPHPRPSCWAARCYLDTVSRNEAGVLRPRHAKDALDGVRRSALEAACVSLGPYDAGRWTDGSSSLVEHASGSAALPLGSPDSCAATWLPGQPRCLWGLTAQLLAALRAPAERSVLPPIMATDSSQFPVWQQHPNRPHEFLLPQTPSRRWSRSALARWRCATASPRRFVPCRFRWRIGVALLAPHFPMTPRSATQRDSGRQRHHCAIPPAGLRQCLARGLPHCSEATGLEGRQGGKGRRAHRMTGACRCGRTPFLVSTRTSFPSGGSAHRRDATPAHSSTGLHALRITRNPLCRWCRPFFTAVTGPPLPPPEPLPGVSAATPCRPASGGLTSSCPTCGRVRLSVHSMRAHARRTRPGVIIV
ncbi:hypothetical protein Tc00.1047053511255.655 [Trypanosoma cruzi]|uniref:Uncharacterized protein n=1 Tax=Trypanosoma cruzi (strain CL Brener) TaxID=353153 RepID=Q4E4X0_TRYCC|nr:hypothetical protein Tc00.1047053511255.655 [Trypanosoma cruzi]EAN99847.1 hypothetical protein Tc00.1047053511255.655 [Trypanosoma cruzi]|eukprot:XP_821698.1 hypothetical protein [Trypanosoma cruzi strain CL Brener]